MLPQRVCLLAAGRGRRAGGPKAWMPSGGRALLERQAGFLTSLFDPGDVFISIQHAWLERCRSLHPGIRWVPVDPDLPAFGALQRLFRAAGTFPLPAVPGAYEAPGKARTDAWAFVYHVDMPLWERGLFESLSRAISEAGPAHAVVPARDGRGGHPVLLSPALAGRVLSADPLRDRLDRLLSRGPVHRVEVQFACIHENWNEVIPP